MSHHKHTVRTDSAQPYVPAAQQQPAPETSSEAGLVARIRDALQCSEQGAKEELKWLPGWAKELLRDQSAELERVTRQRDRLLAALKRVETFWQSGGSRSQYEALRKQVQSVIAAVEGEGK